MDLSATESALTSIFPALRRSATTRIATASAAPISHAAMRGARDTPDSIPTKNFGEPATNPCGVNTVSNSRRISSAFAGRAAGSFSSVRAINRASGAGTSARATLNGRGASARCAVSTRCVLSRTNGGAPVSSSYARQPHAYRSARPSMSASPAICSGAMYAGVPIAMPDCVSVPPPPIVRDADSALAIPKSVTTAVPCDSNTLSGLISRCTTPRAWAYDSARATSRRMLTHSGIVRAGVVPSRPRSDSP